MTPTVQSAPDHRRLWILFGATLFVAFFILGFFAREVYRQAPPIPSSVRTADGTVLFTDDDILTGQQVWQSTGGQQLGSVWGHGAYQAPDWSADWLHREAETLLNLWSTREYGVLYTALDPARQGALVARLGAELRTNTFDPATRIVTVSRSRHRDSARGGTLRRAV